MAKYFNFLNWSVMLTYVQNPMLSLQEDVVEPQVTVECLLTLAISLICVNQHVNILYCDPLAVVLAGTTSVPVSRYEYYLLRIIFSRNSALLS